MKSGEVSLHIYPNFFTLIRKKNSRCIGRWQFEQLFNYGPVDGGFVFRVENVSEDNSEPESFLLVTSSEKQINSTFDTVYKTAHNMYGSAGECCLFINVYVLVYQQKFAKYLPYMLEHNPKKYIVLTQIQVIIRAQLTQ